MSDTSSNTKLTNAERIRRYVERKFLASGHTTWPTVRQVARGLKLSIQTVMLEIEGGEDMFTSYYNTTNYDTVPDGDRFVEVV